MSRTADEEELFAKEPIGRAVFSMILPTIISQIIIVIYNLADTLYVGLTENANAVAAMFVSSIRWHFFCFLYEFLFLVQ